MTKTDIEHIIKALFKDNYRLYPEHYTDPSGAILKAVEVALGYWNRRDTEIERDEKAGVTFSDYRKWVLEELKELVSKPHNY